MTDYLTPEAMGDKINRLQDVYEIDEEKFYTIVEYWADADASTQDKLVTSFKELLKVVSDEIATMEEAVDLQSSCRMGCAFCCYFPIIVNKMEAKLMIKAIDNFPEKRKTEIQKHLSAYYENYDHKRKQLSNLNFNEDKDFKLKYRKEMMPCPLLNTETNQCMAYELRPIPCRTYMNYTDPKICEDHLMPKETVSFEFLYSEYMGALNEFMQFLYEEGDTGFIEYPNDVYDYDYLVNWLRDKSLEDL